MTAAPVRQVNRIRGANSCTAAGSAEVRTNADRIY
jgi:hypothetical protein